MVEGPGATRNAKKVQKVIGWKIEKAVRKSEEFSKLHGAILKEAFCVGKEVFLCFDDVAIRLHFGMNGSLWIRDESAKVDPWKTKDITFVLHLVDEDSQRVFILETSGSTVSETTVRVARSKRERLHHLDVCGGSFQVDQVLLAVKTRHESMISDVLLDQGKVPGVGNIIKIEGLHEAGIHPRRLVSSLDDNELRNVVQSCRTYAMRWFQNGRAPTKQVYNATTCGTCHTSSIRMVKLGNDLRRVTFWCDKCQPFSPESSSQLNQPSTLSGWTTKEHRNIGCPQHGEAALLLRRVRKTSSIHRQRLFYTCKCRHGCQYFQWADGHLPSCRCGKKCCMLISKTERTGGRWFLACTQNACGHFAWATTAHIIAFGQQLTPLR
jgi:formamidopyrimidine-DNA glycosylase